LVLEQIRQQNDLAIRKFEGVVIGPLVLLIDPPKDRCPVTDYTVPASERPAHALYLACKGQLRPR
jgi:hypothetical protein